MSEELHPTQTDNEVHERIIDWVEHLTTLTAVKNHESGKRLSGRYLLVNYVSGPNDVRFLPVDVEFEDQENGDVHAVPVIESEWKFSIHSYRGDDVTQPLRLLRSFAKMEGPQLKVDPRLSIFEVGDVTNLPEVIKNEPEDRAHCMVKVRGYTRDGFLIDCIEESAPIIATRI